MKLRIAVLTALILVASSFVIAKKATTVRTLIMASTPTPVFGTSVLNTSAGKVKHNNGNHFGKLAEMLGFTASAQSAEIPSAQPQSFQGFCSTLRPGVQTVIFGLGRLTDPDCFNATNTITGSGVYIDQDGTLGNLVVLADGQGNDDTDGTVEVWINRAGVPRIQTTLTCNVGLGPICKDPANRFPVLDGDRIFARWLGNSGNYSNLQVTFNKT